MNIVSTIGKVYDKMQTSIATRRNLKFIQTHASELRHLPVGAGRYKVALHFPDEMINAYQVRQWYEPLMALAEFVPVVIIVRSPETALHLRKECRLPVHYADSIKDVERLMKSQDLRVVLYPNQNIRNFQVLRFNEPNHVFVCHGESEKAYMWSNQLKAYDYVFSAGQAAKDRLEKHLRNFDASSRCRLIGRPQIDVDYPAPVQITNELPTILYAPTWEGDRPSMRYGSVQSHGEKLIDALINDGGFNIIFRPHPRSGQNSATYKQTLERIASNLQAHNESSKAQYIVDDSLHWGWQWSVADLCITDISAVAYDFLATGKPMFVTKPVSAEATVDDSAALTHLPELRASDVQQTGQMARKALSQENLKQQELVNHYFGDVSPGASMNRFINQTLALVNESSPTQG